MILSFIPSLILGFVQGTVEGDIINKRTRLGKPDMSHTWSVAVRIAWTLAITYVFAQYRDGSMVLLFLAVFATHLTTHRLGVNLMRGNKYRVKWYDMGRDWYDGLWVHMMAGDIEHADDDDEARGFIAACLIELALSATLYLVLYKLTRP